MPSEACSAPVFEASLGAYLEELLHARCLPRGWVQRVFNPSDLPVALERRVRARSPAAVWRAYTDGVRLWCATCVAVDASAYRPSAVALEVLFFENDGALCSGGIWTCSGNGVWRLEKPIDGS
jgi:hypothetical protein